ncbi:MAG TPA: hypothetical protein VM187_14265, partial [Niastella sp.]|nr:hypothetical protein [Niastella sp.]
MLRNYFTIAWRNLFNHRFYSAVNIIGLATGLAFALLTGGYVWRELQVNSQIKNITNQYIIQS